MIFYSSDLLYFSSKTCELGVKYILLQHVFPSAFGQMSKNDNKTTIYETTESFDTQDSNKE